MFNFNLPITETLMGARTIELTLEELLRAFPNGKDRTKEFSDRYQGEVFFSLDSESSAYGNATDVIFVDPEIPIHVQEPTTSVEEARAEPSSTTLVEQIRQSDLFTGGYADHKCTLKDICPQLSTARYLLGNPGVKNSRPVFMVGGGYPTAALVLIHHQSRVFTQELPLDFERSIFLSVVDSYDRLTLELDLEYLFGRKTTPDFYSSRHYFSLANNILSQFPQKFEYVCRDNGVKYDEAWVIDQYGNELPPDLVEEKPLTSTGEGGYVLKTWLHPENFICCACETAPNGEVRLIYQRLQYEAQGVFEPDKYNELMRRRLWAIGHQVKQKLIENHLRYSDDLDGFAAPRWDTCSYYKGVKMQL